MNDLVSIIINVYNGEKYIAKCLESVLNQTYTHLEILIINDGSTDDTLKICQSYTDNRIRIINQENMGLSLSRNVGIDNAHGDYLYFVDADDWIESDTIEYLHNLCIQNNTDLAICNSIDFLGSNTIIKQKQEKIQVISSLEMLKIFLINDRLTPIWNKLIRREAFNNIRFENRIINDVVVTHKVIMACKSISYSNLVTYYYYRNPDSITAKRKTNINRLIDLYNALTERYEYIDKAYPNLLENRIRIIQSIPRLYLYKNDELTAYLDKQNAMRIFKERFTLKILTCNIKLSEKIKIILFKMSPKLCMKIYKRYEKNKEKKLNYS